MTFPLKFKERLELTKDDIDIPSEAWIVYAICGCEADSCGWEGWMIESATLENDTGEKQLRCMNGQVCPECGKAIFRTDTQIKMKYSENQDGLLKEGKDYKSITTEYE